MVSFGELIRNTNWGEIKLHKEHTENIGRVFIADDASEDGTREYLEEAAKDIPVPVIFSEGAFRGPVRAMNWYLDVAGSPDGAKFIKIDNDFVVCPGWLDEVALVDYLNPGIDIIGMEPMHGPPAAPPAKRKIREAPWIGGKGLIRHRAFTYCRPAASGPGGRRGFTEYQSRHKEIIKGWIEPDLPCFGLDQLPFEPWISLTEESEKRKWARRWGPYDDSMYGYWEWLFPDWEQFKRTT